MLSQDSVDQYLDEYFSKRSAEIRGSSDSRPPSLQRVTLDLTTARPEGSVYRVSFPFKAVFIEDATDTSVVVNLALHSNDSSAIANYKTLKIGDSFASDRFVSEASIWHTAQSGKSITLVFATDGDFRPGTQRSVSSGGLAIIDGSASVSSIVTLVAATAAALAGSDSSRKKVTLQNKTGAALWIGSTVLVTNTGSTRGIEISDGDSIEWQNTSSLFAYSILGGIVAALTES